MHFYYILLTISIVLNVTAQVFLKLNGRTPVSFPGMLWQPFFWLALLTYGASFIAYSIVLSKLELSRVYPIASLSLIVMVLIISALFLGESLTTLKVVGAALSVISIFLLLK